MLSSSLRCDQCLYCILQPAFSHQGSMVVGQILVNLIRDGAQGCRLQPAPLTTHALINADANRRTNGIPKRRNGSTQVSSLTMT